MCSIENLIEAMKSGNLEESVAMTRKVIETGVSSFEVLHSMTKAMREVGDAFEKLEIFLPQMIMASDAMIGIMKILEPILKEQGAGEGKKTIKAVMASVKGDVHEIGKNIVITIFRANRFEVVDLGADVDSLEIINTAEREKADLIGLSSLMTTTMPGQKEVIDILKEKDLRDRFRVIIGGAPVSQDWANKIGADGWAGDASSAVRVVEGLMNTD